MLNTTTTGGKTSERLIEELVSNTMGFTPLFAQTPIEVFNSTLADPDFAGETVELPEVPNRRVFNAMYVNVREHIVIILDKHGSGNNYDWYLVSRSPDRVQYYCYTTGSTLKIRIYSHMITEKIRETFTPSAIEARVAKQDVYKDVTPYDAWQIVDRIIVDLLTGDLTKKISEKGKKPSTYLDVHTVLPLLGFTYDSEIEKYSPPRCDSEDQFIKLRRLLLEVRLEMKVARISMATALGPFFGVEHSVSHLSAPCYGCLGIVDSKSSYDIRSRYRSQVTHDQYGAPWYLDSVKQIATITGSEDLETLYLEEISLNVCTLSSLVKALDDIGLTIETLPDYADNQLLELASTLYNPTNVLNALNSVRKSDLLKDAYSLTTMNSTSACSLLELPSNWDVSEVESKVINIDHTSPIEKLTANYALRTLALESRDNAMLCLYEKLNPYNIVPTAEEAFHFLRVNESVDDQMILMQYSSMMDEAVGDEVFQLRQCVRVIGTQRQSLTLLSAVSMIEKPAFKREGPVGLWNIGNTCYLNSLLQFYYSLEPVREFVVDYAKNNSFGKISEEKEVGEDSVAIEKKIGGRKVPAKEIKRSEIFAKLLGNLYGEISDTQEAQVTPSEMLAYMALVPPQEDADDVLNDKDGENGDGNMAQRLQAALRRQQDVTECIENVLFQLEATMAPTSVDSDGEQEDLIKDLFYGSTVQTLQRIKDGGNKRTKLERFSSLLLNVGDSPTDIYDSLDTFFAEDTVDVEDGPTLRTLRLSKPPQILQIQVQRVQFDLNTYMPYKNLNPLVFDEVVYLDRYLVAESGSELENKVNESKEWKKELSQVESILEENSNSVNERNALLLASRYCSHINRARNQDTTVVVNGNDLLTESVSKDVVSNDDAQVTPNESGDVKIPNDAANDPTKVCIRSVSADDSASMSSTDPQTVLPQSDGAAPISNETIYSINLLAENLSTKLHGLESQIEHLKFQLKHQFDGMRKYGYRIHALFMHRGDVSYGHYWVYIFDSESGKFYKYNDEFVSEAPETEVFDFDVSNTATPYFLVFTRIEESQ
ncbi:ubiquitin-specific protease [Starmerella bacillaris]|uniref:ubiquitinyl hydrolase 1 n=1 Tax=Starmerella bacillaris TaxID=1247836 RepID=A0AAV5RJN4_STABA|nr:ubiquitin-specific protease [Starmerella bacillaris]